MRFLAIALAVLCSLVTACVRPPSVSALEAEAIESAAVAWLITPGKRNITSADWPEAIRALSPKSVRVSADGVYVVTSSIFVEEAGVFIPRDTAFSPGRGGDPEYKSIHGRVFSYRVRG